MGAISTIAEINKQARAFWTIETARMEQRMADMALREIAFESLNDEMIRNVPLRCRKSLETALLDAENKRNTFSNNFSQKGGKAKKTDALQELIIAFVRKTPDISVNILEKQIRAEEFLGIIEEVTAHEIHFANHDGHSKSARLPGLKHRLTRARKKLQNP